ncbi:Platelet glycoprotein 4 isoform 1 [Schistosoma japonicum]|uniref:Platelet glycoprotein 4 isoform 1 n=3 Tax=Schistosoma japonicum TaxID=6182 RepID=A0A4Z2D9Q7_SCHJA|nr:Platelet glycoprotein 4 isoform 1 [Schistosoma japonicum]TNN13243.1 Platelet glycoprotein 4 isoform 1 [Schistosoma japonicum]
MFGRKIRLTTMHIPFVLSFLMFTASVVLHLYLGQIFKSVLKWYIVLTPGSAIYESWASNSTSLLTSIYIFNLQNEQEVLNGGKPFFKEVGPFRFRKVKFKWDLSFSSESPPKSLRYSQKNVYLPHESLPLSYNNTREVTTMDIFTGGLVARPMDKLNKNLFRNTQLFVTKPPREILWGYSNEVLEKCGGLFWCPDKVSVLMKENSSETETLEIKTGVDDINERGRVVEFNGKKKFNAWDNEYANMFNGSEGAFMGFDLRVGDVKYVFVNGLCRSVVMVATELIPHPKYPKLKVLKFEPAEGEIDPNIYPHSTEFCKGKSYEPRCAPKSLVAFSPCIEGNLPIYGSQGHFLGANRSIRDQFTGINEPDETTDKTVMFVEPLSGITFGAFQVMQLSYYIDNTNLSVLPFENVGGPFFFPLIRIVNEADISEETLDTIYRMIYGTQEWLNLGVHILGAVSLLVFFFTTATIIYLARSKLAMKAANKQH